MDHVNKVCIVNQLLKYTFLINLILSLQNLTFASQIEGEESKAGINLQAQNAEVARYLDKAAASKSRAVMIVGCGHACENDFFDGTTHMQAHKHYGDNFYIDHNRAVKPDLVKDFPTLTSDDIPDESFDTIYFEYMTNHIIADLRNPLVARADSQNFVKTAYRILRPGGQAMFDVAIEKGDYYRPFIDEVYFRLKKQGFINFHDTTTVFNNRFEQGEHYNENMVSFVAQKPKLAQ
jgi:Methyltransferase domain.